MTLSTKAKTALAAAYASKGKNRGQLLAKCPRSETLAAAAWQGAYESKAIRLIGNREGKTSGRGKISMFWEPKP